jgi:dienelactone hydrolase
VEIHVQRGAGHAFDNHESAMFWNEAAAAVAWEHTVDFLRRYLPVA